MSGHWRCGDVEVEVLSARGGVSTGLTVRSGVSVLLVDCGDGVARDLADRRLAADELAAVVLTHDHGDHMGGLMGLLWWQRLRHRTVPLPILRPEDAPLARGTIALFRDALGPRARLVVDEHTLAEDVPVRAGVFEVTPFPVRHRSSSSGHVLMEVHGLSIAAAGLRIVVSSDTGPCERLEREVDGADLAVLDATWPAGTPGIAPDTHLTADQAAAIGRRAKAWLPYHVGE